MMSNDLDASRYVEHILEDGTKHEELELATLRQKTQAQTLEKHVQDSLHSFHEALRRGASEWSLLDDELQVSSNESKSWSST